MLGNNASSQKWTVNGEPRNRFYGNTRGKCKSKIFLTDYAITMDEFR